MMYKKEESWRAEDFFFYISAFHPYIWNPYIVAWIGLHRLFICACTFILSALFVGRNVI